MSSMSHSTKFALSFALLLSLSAVHADEQCKVGSEKCVPTSECSNAITGFSIFYSRPEDSAAYVQDLRPLISASRNEPGNCGYHMFVDPTKPGQVGFIEKWANGAALQDHLKGTAVTSTFGHQYYAEIKSQPPLLAGPWIEVGETAAADEEIEMVFYWTMDCPKKHVWDIITNWSDASWVKGNPKTTIVPIGDDGVPLTDEEAAAIKDVDPDPLGPVVQRRSWGNGAYVDVKMLTKTENNFTTVQQTLSALVFPKVTFDKFFVTLTLDSDGLDADTQSRMRYHTRATLKTGTFDEARETLKSDFYGPRIEFYQEYFNCSSGIQLKRVENTIETLHKALREDNRDEEVPKLFADEADGKEFLERTLEDDGSDFAVEVKLPFQIFGTPDHRVVAVEDIVTTSLLGTTLKPRIVIYQLDAWGRIVSTRIFDELQAEKNRHRKAKSLIHGTDRYFRVLATRNMKKLRNQYADEPVLEDPVGFMPPRTFDSVYNAFYSLQTSYEYLRSPLRSFVDVKSKQTAQVIDATVDLSNGKTIQAHPVQVFTFDKEYKITHFEAFFRPVHIDFSKLE